MEWLQQQLYYGWLSNNGIRLQLYQSSNHSHSIPYSTPTMHTYMYTYVRVHTRTQKSDWDWFHNANYCHNRFLLSPTRQTHTSAVHTVQYGTVQYSMYVWHCMAGHGHSDYNKLLLLLPLTPHIITCNAGDITTTHQMTHACTHTYKQGTLLQLTHAQHATWTLHCCIMYRRTYNVKHTMHVVQLVCTYVCTYYYVRTWCT